MLHPFIMYSGKPFSTLCVIHGWKHNLLAGCIMPAMWSMLISKYLLTLNIFWMCRFLWLRIYIVSLQPSLLAMGLLCYEAQEQHDPEHSDTLTDVLESLQQQLNVSRTHSHLNVNVFSFLSSSSVVTFFGWNPNIAQCCVEICHQDKEQALWCFASMFSISLNLHFVSCTDQRWGPGLCARAGWKMPAWIFHHQMLQA